MRKQSGDIELIEVFAPDDVALWAENPIGLAPPTAPSSGSQPARRGVVAGVFVTVVAAVVAVVALSDDNNSASAPTTTMIATTTTQRLPFDPVTSNHFVVDDPTLTPYAADIVTPPLRGEQVQVWSNGTPDGPIVIVELHPYAYQGYGVVGATRTVVNGLELVHPSDQEDSIITEITLAGEWSLTVHATGLTDIDVAHVASSVLAVDGQLVDASEAMHDLGLAVTLQDESVSDLMFGRVESEVRYLTADGQIATLRNGVGSSDRRLAAFPFLTRDPEPFFRGYSFGHLLNGDGIVVWEEGDRLLSLVAPAKPGDLIPDDLIILSRKVRAATASEWSDMVYGLRPDYTLGDFETLATGRASTGEPWRVGTQIAQRGGRTEFLWWWTVPGLTNVTASTAASLAVGTRPVVETVVVPGATFVFVTDPNSRSVTVTTASGVEYSAQMTQPFAAQSPVHMAVVRVEEPGSVTVAIDGLEIAQ